jgi:CRP-like cAMP-binding protein
MTAPPTSNTKNRLLAALSKEDADELWPHLEPVSLSLKRVLYPKDAPIERIYFIEQGVVSVLTVMANGAMGEVGMIGFEGMAGAPVLLGAATSAQHVMVQIPGTALCIDAAPCSAAFNRLQSFRATALRFVEAFLALGAQTAACNLHHSAEQRFARWLLMARERVDVDTMPMTHEFLSVMLGIRRSGVTAIAGTLQRAGLIRYHRGRVEVTDRDGLEAAACECYRIDRERVGRLP